MADEPVGDMLIHDYGENESVDIGEQAAVVPKV
jgi:hypothetical protein